MAQVFITIKPKRLFWQAMSDHLVAKSDLYRCDGLQEHVEHIAAHCNTCRILTDTKLAKKRLEFAYSMVEERDVYNHFADLVEHHNICPKEIVKFFRKFPAPHMVYTQGGPVHWLNVTWDQATVKIQERILAERWEVQEEDIRVIIQDAGRMAYVAIARGVARADAQPPVG